ncbi:snare-like protein [Gonapodya prolifera JEL478]|uniref:Snare-like protein n=1 Tax=Gonapodya prolifera (strain JEL478) TaxID=1344416 RepID=A0A139AX55_GONPJ|nr:snare-like protein [Gonapodya prolifera JEL478]|eukprot:KXS21331.1 snare-like protein [Gonapodya prolifera JEL478]
MRVLGIAIVQQATPGNILLAEFDLSSFGFFERGAVNEFLLFTSRTLAERTKSGERQKVEQAEQKVVAYVHARPEGATGVLISDLEYPLRAAFSILNKVLDEFFTRFPATGRSDAWAGLEPARTQTLWPELKGYVSKFQDPHAADPFLRVQKELDETKIVLHKTMESLLQRGEKLDDLVARSDMLSQQSKLFYTTAKKTNACCSWT